MSVASWVESLRDGSRDSAFGPENLPLGVCSVPDVSAGAHATRRRVCTVLADRVVDLAPVAERTGRPELAELFAADVLNPLLAGGPAVWREARARMTEWLTGSGYESLVRPHLLPRDQTPTHLPFRVADYVDFYASEQHAANVGRIFRPGSAPLPPNWRHLPIGYHGRSGTVLPSGTPVLRPCGQRRPGPDQDPVFGPSTRLDIEAEVGFVVGAPSTLGRPVDVADFPAHVFGALLVNDWSARDIQAWEYVPLGPFLGKSFATSVSPWVVPLDALRAARTTPPAREPQPLPYLRDENHPWGLDLTLEVRLNGHLLSSPPFAGMYWTAAQQLAHLTVNGASLRTGDLFASGTVSGDTWRECGSLLEMSWGGAEPLTLPDGSCRSFLADGDEVRISASAPGPDGSRIDFGEVTGRVEPAVERG